MRQLLPLLAVHPVKQVWHCGEPKQVANDESAKQCKRLETPFNDPYLAL